MPDERPTAALTRAEHETLHDRVYREVKRAIMSGAIAPGATITIRSLAAALGTSPMPVREALRRLVAERALDMLPTRSVTLPVMTPAKFDEICRLRIAIEGMVAEAATPRLAPESVRRMKQLDDKMSRLEKRFTPEYLACNQEFHFTLYQAAGLPLAMAMIESLWLQSGPLLNHVMTQYGERLGNEHHGAALKALARRDGPAVRAEIEADIREAGEIILSLLASESGRASL
jgi:DNA-binding GntR family transcriptional regulator